MNKLFANEVRLVFKSAAAVKANIRLMASERIDFLIRIAVPPPRAASLSCRKVLKLASLNFWFGFRKVSFIRKTSML